MLHLSKRLMDAFFKSQYMSIKPIRRKAKGSNVNQIIWSMLLLMDHLVAKKPTKSVMESPNQS